CAMETNWDPTIDYW
nr:immunoglobulin heavy chain junction region [Mus musculus]